MSLEEARMKSLKDQHLEQSNEDLEDELDDLENESYFCEECDREHRLSSNIGKEHYEQ